MNLAREPLRANVELKARIDDRDAASDIARGLGAEEEGERRQVDTYFSLGRYRLKLRETSNGEAWLIGYSRPDSPDPRKSQYRLTPVEDADGTRKLLGKQWGVKVIVRKWRQVFIWQNRVRIHIDQVETLGDFLEFEAVLDPDDPEYDEGAALLDVSRLVHDFGIADRDLVSTSYSTLVQNGQEIPSGT